LAETKESRHRTNRAAFRSGSTGGRYAFVVDGPPLMRR